MTSSNASGCAIEGCEGKHFGKGFCQKHYNRWRKYGDPLIAKRDQSPIPIGTPYARLLVSGTAGCTKNGDRLYLCECECGTIVTVRGADLKSGRTRSCGCLKRDVSRERHMTHGLSDTPTYNSITAAIRRCYDSNHPSYHNYGGRGVKCCERYRYVDTAAGNVIEDIGLRPKGKTLDRIVDSTENPGHYSCGKCWECIENGWPANVQWLSMSDQIRTQRRYKEKGAPALSDDAITGSP